ncbi:MAG: hypothetical protein AMJ78_04515 [Omnitrophica WOR_2 bacterium SM23_29]|nr:MAG: hypothetical protein AMJ78_04515 [Omnitrophica WOR_2 bacterium SM23_29]
MKLGVHVSIAGHIYEAVDRAAQLRCDTFQIFSRNPRGWAVTKLDPKDAEEFKRRRKEKSIAPVVVHIPYLINLCSPEENLWKRSVNAYIEDIKRADMLGAEYFVTHLGSHKGKGEEFGISRFSSGLNEAIKKTEPKLMILLENTAGSGNWLGYKFEHLKTIIDKIKDKKHIGICLDTAHTFESGYDVKTKAGLDSTLRKIDSIVGLDKIKVIHLNDSKTAFGSHADRHWHIGKGEIGMNGMSLILNHPKLKGLPFILETPKKDLKDDRTNLATVRKLAK